MKKMNKILALNIIFIATVFLLSWCNSNINTSNDLDNISNATDNISTKWQLEDELEILQWQKQNFSFPDWLWELNIVAPKYLKLDKTKSQKTTEKIEWFNSIHFVYKWDYDISMQQAKLIAEKADIPVSKEFKMAQEILSSLSTWDNKNSEIEDMLWDMKWIVYTNYNLMDKKAPDYTIAITVNEDWSLELDVTDMLAMEKVTDEFIK